MKAFWRRLLAFFGIRPTVRWEDGVVVTGEALVRYTALYAYTVAWVRAIAPQYVQSPEFRVTVRLYERFPSSHAGNLGKVLAPNTIPGDTGGTLCLYKGGGYPNDTIIRHEMKHAVTGISDHPLWLFPTPRNS